MLERRLNGWCINLCIGGEGEVGVNGAVEHHRPDMTGEQLRVDGAEGRPVGHAVEVDPLDPERNAQPIHVPRRCRGRHGREQRGVGGLTRSLQAGERPGRCRRAGDRTARRRRRRSTQQRFARARSPLVEAHQGELIPHRHGHERRQDRQDQQPALPRPARVEHDVALAVRHGMLHHRQVHRAPGGMAVVERDRDRSAQIPRDLRARHPRDGRGSGRRRRRHGRRGRPGTRARWLRRAPTGSVDPGARRACYRDLPYCSSLLLLRSRRGHVQCPARSPTRGCRR